MARAHVRSTPLDTFQMAPTPDTVPNFQPAFGLLGMNTVDPLTRMQPGVARMIRNMVIREGAYQTRDGVSQIGDPASAAIVGLAHATTSDGVLHVFRFYVDGLDKLVAGIWNAQGVGSDTINLPATKHLAWTGWGETILFTAGEEGIYQTDFSPAPVATLISDTPLGVHHLTSFNKRVIASHGRTVQWSANSDSNDWTGLGSGYEDFIAAPGGVTDFQTAVVPITEGIALVIRSNSIWQMQPTGNFDAPFRFSQLYGRVGSRYPATVVPIPQGAIMLGEQAVWLVTLNGFEDIGQPIRSLLREDPTTLDGATASYDEKWGEYRLSIGDKVLRYNLAAKAWTEDRYQFAIKSMIYSQAIQTLSTIPDESDDRRGGFIYAFGGDGRLVARDRLGIPLDINAVGVEVDVSVRLETGLLIAENPLYRVGITEVQVEHEADEEFLGVFDYSTDGGESWVLLSVQTFQASLKPVINSIQRWVERDTMQLGFSCPVASNIRLVGMYPAVVKGARKGDAR